MLNHDLTHSHSFGVHSHGVSASHVACDSDGVVFVADSISIQSFSIDGRCISKYSYDFIPGTSIVGICIDSTNTLYALDEYKKCVSVLSSSGKLIKYITYERKLLAGIAVDKTTGTLYVCDSSNDCVIVY